LRSLVPFDDYRWQSRGGKGIITMRTGEKTGDVVSALTVREADEIMLITNKGEMVRTRVKEIRETGRNTMGVKLMDLRNGEKLQAIAPVVSQVEEEEAPSQRPKSPNPTGQSHCAGCSTANGVSPFRVDAAKGQQR